MSIDYTTVQDRIRERYVREPEIIHRLRAETASHPNAMMILDEQAAVFLTTLVTALQPKRTLDIGVFTGFSSLAVTMNAPQAQVIALDIDAETTQTARKYWKEAGVADRVDLRIGPALESLDRLLADGQAGTFDFAFIDADKPGYPDYVDRVVELLRPGGAMLLDNMLRSVLDEPHGEAELLDALTRRMADDDRLVVSALPLGSGMTFAAKRV